MPAKKSNPDAMTMRPTSIGNALNHTGKAQNTPIKNDFIFNALNQKGGKGGASGTKGGNSLSINGVGVGKTDISIPTVKELTDRTTKQVKALKSVAAKRGKAD
jgi:hypothetical protein